MNYLACHIVKLQNIITHEIINTRVLEYDYYYEKYKMHWRSQYNDSGTIQQTICGIINDWKSYYKAFQQYKRMASPYSKCEPKAPGYKNILQQKEIIVVRSAIKVHSDCIIIQLTKATSEIFKSKILKFDFNQIWGKEYYKKQNTINIMINKLRQLRLKWYSDKKTWVLYIIYECEINLLPKEYKNVMAIDLGLNNLCALTFRFGLKSYLINGRPLKSANSRLNYLVDQKQSQVMKLIGSSSQYKDTEEIISLRNKRNNYVHNYMHQVSKQCIDIAINEKCRVIVMGDIKGIKVSKQNKSFVQIPLLYLAYLIKYKAEKCGIKVVLINEAYTSICSAIDLEDIKYRYNRINRRIFRGAFVCNQGHIINSDINGSLNILRLFLKQVYQKRLIAQQKGLKSDLTGSIPELITFIRDKGTVVCPIKLEIFK